MRQSGKTKYEGKQGGHPHQKDTAEHTAAQQSCDQVFFAEQKSGKQHTAALKIQKQNGTGEITRQRAGM